MLSRPAKNLIQVRVLSVAATRGTLEYGPLRLRCAIGRGGITARKREGDGATPAGRLRPLEVRWRPDRERRPPCHLPVRPIRRGDGWCDAPADRNYNRPVRHPYPASAEHLWRDDGLYDLIVVLDHNCVPRVAGHGSAIFMHVARPGYRPTEGCIALQARDLRLLLLRLRPHSSVAIGPKPASLPRPPRV